MAARASLALAALAASGEWWPSLDGGGGFDSGGGSFDGGALEQVGSFDGPFCFSGLFDRGGSGGGEFEKSGTEET